MAAKIIAFAQIKGGTGKSTLTMQVALELSKRHDVAVVGGDMMGSVEKYDMNAADDEGIPFPVVPYPGRNIGPTLINLLDDFDYILVDTPPSGEATAGTTKNALIPADLVVIPMIPSPLATREMGHVEQLLDDVNEERRKLNATPVNACIAVNRFEPGRVMSKQLPKTLKQLPITVLKTKVEEREAFEYAAFRGCAVADVRDCSWKEAARDIKSLTKEIVRITK